MGLLDIDGIKAVKLSDAGLHQEWLGKFNFGLYPHSTSLHEVGIEFVFIGAPADT
jgi:hypothetical protein